MVADLGGVRLMPERWVSENYREFAEEIGPRLRTALAGERDVPPQKPFVEAWLGYSLYYYDKLLSLEEVIESADAINHGIPNPDEVAWAFLGLRNRGWLSVQGDMYGLTPEGRLAINTIVVQGSLERLNGWISSHPPSGRVTARDIFLTLGKGSAGER
jgi:hypothetical protein